jgi:hypothetical protein
MNQGLYPVSLGLTAYAIPNPSSYANGANIPTGQFVTLADHSAASTQGDWYAQGHPTSYDRGVRNAKVKNDYESGWQSPAPDGLGRWVWGDSNWNTGCWIDTPTKHGFLTVPSFSSGRSWYQNSTLNGEYLTFETQVYNPAHLGEVAQGTRPVWNVQPTNRWEFLMDGMGQAGISGNSPAKHVAGATFDPVSKRLFVFGTWTLPGMDCCVYTYQVNV